MKGTAITFAALVSIVILISGSACSGTPDADFVSAGLYKFGKTEAEVKKTLGEPVRVTEEKSKNLYIEGGTDVIRTLEYAGVSVAVMKAANGNEYIERVTITADTYRFDGLAVGSSKDEVTGRIGEPTLVEGDSIYYSAGMGAAAVRFFFSGGVVTKIVFMSTA